MCGMPIVNLSTQKTKFIIHTDAATSAGFRGFCVETGLWYSCEIPSGIDRKINSLEVMTVVIMMKLIQSQFPDTYNCLFTCFSDNSSAVAMCNNKFKSEVMGDIADVMLPHMRIYGVLDCIYKRLYSWNIYRRLEDNGRDQWSYVLFDIW